MCLWKAICTLYIKRIKLTPLMNFSKILVLLKSNLKLQSTKHALAHGEGGTVPCPPSNPENKKCISSIRQCILLRSEIPSGICAKLRSVAASNNRVHMPWSLCYCLLAPHICTVLFFSHIPFVMNHTINATPPERLQQYYQYSAVYTKIFNFRRITLFCLEKRLWKHKMTIF